MSAPERGGSRASVPDARRGARRRRANAAASAGHDPQAGSRPSPRSNSRCSAPRSFRRVPRPELPLAPTTSANPKGGRYPACCPGDRPATGRRKGRAEGGGCVFFLGRRLVVGGRSTANSLVLQTGRRGKNPFPTLKSGWWLPAGDKGEDGGNKWDK